MKKYWKLLDIEHGTYTTHETEEEINHMIDFNTQYLNDDKVTKRITISTPFANYDFQFISVFDEYYVHRFLYFFDSVEEEYDSLAERARDISFDPCIDTPLIRNLAYESQNMIHEICKEFDERTKSLMERIKELESHSESNQLDEIIELQTQRDNLVNKNAELNGKLIRYAGEIDELKEKNDILKKSYEQISSLYKKAQNETFTARRSRDFWHRKFIEAAHPDDYPF